MLPQGLQRLPQSSISAHGITSFCEIRTILVPVGGWATKPRKKQLKPQTYNMATRASSSPSAPPSLRASSPPPASPSCNRPCRAYAPSQGACFSKGNASSVYQRTISVSSSCDGKLLTRYRHSKSKKSLSRVWTLRVTNPGQFCRHQLALHFEMSDFTLNH